jgi:hypothetical protein
MADDEGVDGDQIAGVMGLDVAFAELGAEALQRLDLLLRLRECALRRGLLQAQQAVVAAEQAMSAPYPSDSRRAHLDGHHPAKTAGVAIPPA